MKETEDPSNVVINKPISIEELKPHTKIINQLKANMKYSIQTCGVYQTTNYNADEALTLYSGIVTQRTEGM